jgi:zinc protease
MLPPPPQRSTWHRPRVGAGCALVLVLLAASGQAAVPSPPVPAPSGTSAGSAAPRIAYERFTLRNGMEVITHRDTGLPLVAVNLWYHVGPVNEPRGRSGFAHLFEHLMFEGSRYVGANFDRWLESAGATNQNGTTSWDRTNYFESVPPEYLEMVLWLESDRMGFLRDFVTQERLDVQRDVVKNERRQSYENAPYGPSALALLDTVFPKGHPYHGAVIGSMEDLSAATLQDVRSFFDQYYAPSNATLTIAGDFEPIELRRLVEKYFGPLRTVLRPPAGPQPIVSYPKASRQVIEEPVEVGRVTFAWLAPPAYSKEHAALELASEILAGARATRLYRRLVIEQKIATEVDADVDPNALGTMVTVDALMATSSTVAEVESSLLSELTRLAESPPSPDELARAKRRMTLNLESELQLLNGPGGESGRAGLLQRFNRYLGNPGGVDQWLATIAAVTREDVSRATATYLGSEHRVCVITAAAPKGAKP